MVTQNYPIEIRIQVQRKLSVRCCIFLTDEKMHNVFMTSRRGNNQRCPKMSICFSWTSRKPLKCMYITISIHHEYRPYLDPFLSTRQQYLHVHLFIKVEKWVLCLLTSKSISNAISFTYQNKPNAWWSYQSRQWQSSG